MAIKIMINGLPGDMAAEVLKAAADSGDFEILPFSLTGPDIGQVSYEIPGAEINLIRPEKRDSQIWEIRETHGKFITVDYTHPSAVNDNAEFYCSNSLPFVMGTTGGDREKLDQTVRNADIPAVIAPNMGKQIVGLQMMLEYAADNFPGLFSGYSMNIEESHQSGKADTSGTAKAMVSYFNRMGIPFEVDAIKKIRDPRQQKTEWNIPETNLAGHAYHTYTLLSDDETVDIQFRHNVRGRRIYALGTLDAVRFLHGKISEGRTDLFSMIDILKAGAMK